jgi:hypothetical protein
MGLYDSNNEYFTINGGTGSQTGLPLGSLYERQYTWDPPPPVKYKNSEGKEEEVTGNTRKASPSLFNRYSIFYFNSVSSDGKGPSEPESYLDGPNRRGLDSYFVEKNPTASNLINWSKGGGNNAIDYDWSDFLWCKNYGMVPNNYMVTLRRFSYPVMDDLSNRMKNPAPDIGRMICWVDGESNTWENVGLKFTYGLTWKELESEVQVVNAPEQAGNEGGAFGGKIGGIIKAASFMTQPGNQQASLGNPNASGFNPYENTNKVFGPIDVIKQMLIRDKGLKFEQTLTLKFEYELRSIDGINPKIAMIDLISNVLVCTMNRGSFWGGDVRYIGGNPRAIKPLGDTSKLAKGDYGGYISSLIEGVAGRLDSLTGGQGLSLEGVANAAKNLGSGLLANIVGGGLDKMGRPGVQGVNSLLTGEDTGEWHVTIGNPVNPIISIGNLALESTDMELGGVLGPDDFPTKLIVTCKLKPARPRDRTDMMAMFHKNGRTYLTNPPTVTKYAGNVPNGGRNGGSRSRGQDKSTVFDPNQVKPDMDDNLLRLRFPNHAKEKNLVTEAAKGIS